MLGLVLILLIWYSLLIYLWTRGIFVIVTKCQTWCYSFCWELDLRTVRVVVLLRWAGVVLEFYWLNTWNWSALRDKGRIIETFYLFIVLEWHSLWLDLLDFRYISTKLQSWNIMLDFVCLRFINCKAISNFIIKIIFGGYLRKVVIYLLSCFISFGLLDFFLSYFL